MASAVIRPGQTLADIAVEHLGDVELVFELAALNSLSITSSLVAGQSLTLPDVGDLRITRTFEQRENKPAANIGPAILDGIGVWIIGTTFIPTDG